MASAFIQRLMRTILDILCRVLGLFFPDELGYLPPIQNKLLLQSANRLVEQIKAGTLRSEDVVRAYIERIKQVQPLVNAVVDERFDAAIEEAKIIDKTIADQIEQNGVIDSALASKPLLGVPYTGKDCIPAKGMVWSASIPSRKTHRADVDAVEVKMYREAGAILIAMTAVPELLLWWDTSSVTWGRTCNAYNRGAIVGGSTGGNGCLISTAGSLIGIAGDIGGSIRIPAYFNGVYGHCCSNGTTQHDLHWPPHVASRLKMLYLGPLCRYADDLMPLVKMYTAHSPNNLRLDEEVDVSKLKIHILYDIGDPSLTPTCDEIRQSLNKVAVYLRSKGAQVREIQFANMERVFDMWMSMMQSPEANPMAFEMTNRTGNANLFLELFKAFIGLSHHTLAVIFTAIYRDKLMPLFSRGSNSKERFLAQKSRLEDEMNDLLGEDGVLLMPTFPLITVKPWATFLQFKNTCYTGVLNCINTAITQIPLGLSQKGSPIGFQAVARHLNDRFTIKIAQQLEKEFGGWVPPSTVQC